MAFISPANLATLHAVGSADITALQGSPSGRYASVRPGNQDQVPIVPDAALFRCLPTTDPGPKALPTASECAVHLEMLAVFRALRGAVIQSNDLDKAFGISPRRTVRYRKKREGWKYVAVPVEIRDPAWEDRRKLKWKYYLSIAAARFHMWINLVNEHLGKAAVGAPPLKELLLPPLDVLVIWHGFLLNCEDFNNYCVMHNLQYIQDVAFPWTQIHGAINSDTWEYTLPNDHSDWLKNVRNLEPDLLTALCEAGKSTSALHTLLTTFESCSVSDTETVCGDDSPLFRTIKAARRSEELNEPLVENVQRQCIFVDKMHGHCWIRNPAAAGTMRRAVDRYDKFLHLFRLYPKQFLVPMLDIDLAWHTHQCSAQNYRNLVTERVGRFINHDDKIGRDALDDGFASADQWYRLAFGEQYQVCQCWSCEAIFSAVEELDEELLDDQAAIDGIVKDVEQRVHYHRELEIARRLDRDLPLWSHK